MTEPAKLYFEDVELGDEIGPAIISVGDEQVVDFCSLWGNPAPNRFTDQEQAERVGLSEPIVPGIMSMALVSRVLTDWAGVGTVEDLDLVFRGTIPTTSHCTWVSRSAILSRTSPGTTCNATSP